jgi:hypothetical protein
MWGDPREHI